MRNTEFLDNPRPEDVHIGELQTDEVGDYRIINRDKYYQIKEESQDDKDMNLIINRYVASGIKSPSDYFAEIT